MLELRYNKQTGEVTGRCGDSKQFGNLKKRWGVEEIVILDISLPTKSIEALLYDETTGTIIDNPNYVEPPPSKIEKLEARIAELEILQGKANLGGQL